MRRSRVSRLLSFGVRLGSSSLSWDCWGLTVLALVLFGHRYVPPHWWYISHAKRRAMRAAMRAAQQLHGAELVWPHCFIRRCDRERRAWHRWLRRLEREK